MVAQRPLATALVIAGVAVLFACPAAAQTAPVSVDVPIIDDILSQFKTQFGSIQSTLADYAMRLFWLLAGIEFVWAMILIGLRQPSLDEISAALISQIMFIGMGAAILTYSAEWGEMIVDSFRLAGAKAAVAAGGQDGISPTTVLESGLNIVKSVWANISLYELGDALAYVLGGLIILFAFAKICGDLILSLVSAWAVVSMSVLFLGFGGSRWTRDIASRVLMGIVAAGAHLFVLQVVVGISTGLFAKLVAAPNKTIDDIIVLVATALIVAALTEKIPALVASMISGASFSGGGSLGAAAALAVGAAGGAAASVASGGIALASAVKLASTTTPAAAGGIGAAAARIATVAGGAAMNLARSATADLGNQLGGRANFGRSGARMGADMDYQREDIEARRRDGTPDAPPANSDNTISGGPPGPSQARP